MSIRLNFLLICLGIAVLPTQARAEIPTAEQETLTDAGRMTLARDFLFRVKRGFARADSEYAREHETNADKARRLPDGEDLLLNIRLPKKIVLPTSILGRAENGLIVLSLRDFVSAVDFPIEIDGEAGTANGWYIREKKKFTLDAKTRSVQSSGKQFQFSENVAVRDDDIFVPIDELAGWFGFTLDLNVGALEVTLDSPIPLPIQEKIARGEFESNQYRVGPPKLPLMKEEQAAYEVPFIDVSTRSGYTSPGDDGTTETRSTVSVQTSGDFAYGTLATQTTFEKDEKLTNIRTNYKRESLEKELLGPLKARRYEIGDVTPVEMELRSNSMQGLGARVTDAHPLRNTLRPSTEITGTSFPGWDVELYRDEQLISYQTVGQDGFYRFEDVDLYNDANNFRVVLYGPQGEITEEEVSIPVDTSRIADMGTAYDIVVSAQDTQTYRKNESDDEDVGAPNISAVYEFPVGDSTVASAGFESGSDAGKQEYVGHGGLSTTLSGILFNLDTAVDQDSEMAAQLVARRQIDDHQIRNELKVSTDRYGITSLSNGDDEEDEDDVIDFSDDDGDDEDDDIVDVFSERLNLNGPIPFDLGTGTRYNLGLGYALQSDDAKRTDYSAGVSTIISRVNIGQQFTYSATDTADANLDSKTTITGTVGRNRLRFISDYQIQPESELSQLSAQLNRNLTRNLELDLDLAHRLDPRLTEVAAQLNWDAGFANISPGVAYNTDHDLTATLNTRFGLARNPRDGKPKFFERGITSNGGISAFVFLDKNGDNVFNEGEEILPDVIVKAPQNGGNMATDETGYAFFTRLSAMRPTDVYVDADSLPDPYWIPGFEGVSIIPREGHVTSLEFPVHMSGEMDGTVYAKDESGGSYALRGITLSLYDTKGEKIKSVVSESDGFYLFERVPPGKYYLTVDGSSFKNRMARPKPQEVVFGYEGTTMYGKNVYLLENQPDVPINFLADASSLNLDADKLEGRQIVVNMGSFNSRLTMGLAWFKAKTVLGSLLGGLHLLEKPSESYPDVKTGKYSLRFLADSNNLDDVYEMCRNISARNQICAIDYIVSDKPAQVVADNVKVP